MILYGHWLTGDLSPRVLRCCHFTEGEINGLGRWRSRLLPRLPYLRGKNLQCWCPLTSPWCHADTQIRIVNGPMLYKLAA